LVLNILCGIVRDGISFANTIIYQFIGEPLALSDSWYQATLMRARQSVLDERLHTNCLANPLVGSGAGAGVADPDTYSPVRLPYVHSQMGVADPLEIWRMLPALKELPEQLLQQLPRSEIFQLNAALLKESKSASKIQTNAKLMMNAQSLEKNPTRIDAGYDDRKRVLHRSRFLGGASCSAQQLWLEARQVLGPKGVLPLGNYDLDAVGCGGCVTPRGWQAIHDPSSADLKLKLFYLPNVGGSGLASKKISLEDNDGSISVAESMKDISDMDAFRSALNALREAMACALPWNRSISAICGFLQNTNFCSSDLLQNNKRAAILTEFVDHVLSRNALNWENQQPFLSADDLAHTWATWKARRVSAYRGAEGKQGKKEEGAKKRDNICRKFNGEGCPNDAKDCKTFYGTKLRHVCSFVLPSGAKCQKDHPKPDHK
jgi:hypothetical protein